MGIEAVAKQAESRVLLCELGSLGIEIAKNIVLAGCKELVIFEKPAQSDFQYARGGQFFLSEHDDADKSSGALCRHKLQELNIYVKVTVVQDDKYPTITDYLAAQKKENLEPFKVVVLSEYFNYSQEEVTTAAQFCREASIPFIRAFVVGLMAMVQTDFGEEFKILESTSEEIPDVMIERITPKDQEAEVKLVEGFIHHFQEGDRVQLLEVKGMALQTDQIGEEASINETIHEVSQVTDGRTFRLKVDLKEYSPYESSGLVRYVKTPVVAKFKSFSSYFKKHQDFHQEHSLSHYSDLTPEAISKLQEEIGFLDDNLIWHDFEKLEELRLFEFFVQCHLQNEKVVDLCGRSLISQQPALLNTWFKFVFSTDSRLAPLPPLCAFLGGLVSQEIIKALTQKFNPIKQQALFSCSELVEDIDGTDYDSIGKEIEARICISRIEDSLTPCQRDLQLIDLLGESFVDEIQNCKLFMVGAGAIGCELLKNYSMLGLGTGQAGHITLTDPDVIEVSNLNRQFLFREKHLRKPKSLTAAAAAIQMNS
mmetsp:Transcript_13543/g.21101  ORF Transcript_13543/g.21101 Transcript_13543/m.21101 type:complete len:538 (-) Transcript_13543:1805-3418(-)